MYIFSARFLQNILLVLVALIIWWIFYPGLMTSDSIDQYEQALTGYFKDWHPPLMAISLWVFLKLGFGLGGLMLFQCLSAVFGLRHLTLRLLTFLNKEITNEKARLYATFVTGLLLLPFLSPYIFISIIFWKDAWLTIGLLWLISYLLWFRARLNNISSSEFWIHFVLLSLSWSLIVLVRHNAFVIIPICCLSLTVVCQKKFGRRSLFFSIIPLLFAISINSAVKSIFHVKSTAINNLVVSNDLASMLDLYPELVTEYPATATRQNYAPLWDETSDNKDIIEAHNQDVKKEYFAALEKYPEKLATVRIQLFWRMLYPEHFGTQKMGYDVIEENSYGLQVNKDFKNTRHLITEASWNWGHRWYLIWISGVHLIWFILNILLVIGYLIKVYFVKDERSRLILIILLISLSYYLSYILVATSPDYRFMFPATFLMQVITLALVLSFGLKLKCKSLIKSILITCLR